MKVAILGAGYAGVTATRRLEDALPDGVDLVVVDEAGEHVLRHEIHRVIRRPDFADDLTVPLDDLFDRASVRRARVRSVDPDANRVELDDGSIEYDYAAVCLGSETAFHDLPGVAEHATPLSRIEHAHRIRKEFLPTLESGGRTVVGGAGLSGVQVAGELAALADEEDSDAEVVLVERLDDVAPGFPANFRTALREELAERGIEVRTGKRIEAATAEEIRFDDGSLAYDALVWTGGIRGSDALSGERPEVRSTLRLGDGTFVVGDAARVIDRDGDLVPASAQSAIAGARTAATNVARLVEHDLEGGGSFEPRLDTLDFRPTGWIVSVGDGAVAQVGPTVLRGRSALALKATAGVRYLTSVGAVREALSVARGELTGG